MRKTIWTGTATAIVAAAAVTAMAQAPAPQQNSGASAEKKITVTGCLKPASGADASTTAAPTGTSGTAGAAGTASDADAQFVLADATSSPASNDPSAGTTTAGTAASSTQPAKTYKLIANPSALSPHVGKKLELTGTVEDQAAATSATPGGPAGASTLRVEAGKVIAASCD